MKILPINNIPDMNTNDACNFGAIYKINLDTKGLETFDKTIAPKLKSARKYLTALCDTPKYNIAQLKRVLNGEKVNIPRDLYVFTEQDSLELSSKYGEDLKHSQLFPDSDHSFKNIFFPSGIIMRWKIAEMWRTKNIESLDNLNELLNK